MNFDENDEGRGGGGMQVPPRRDIPHYYGNESRALFVAGAVVLIIAQSTGADLPLSTGAGVLAAVLLVVAAGITNPAQGWIHWLNAFISIYGVILFGTTAISHYRSGISIFNPSFFYIEALALIALIALYFTTRTIRGFHLRDTL